MAPTAPGGRSPATTPAFCSTVRCTSSASAATRARLIRPTASCSTGCRITNAVKCLPPQNKPDTAEIRRCNGYLANELRARPPRAILALGRIAHDAILEAFALRGRDFAFGHHAVHDLPGGVRALRQLPLQPLQHADPPPDRRDVRGGVRRHRRVPAPMTPEPTAPAEGAPAADRTFDAATFIAGLPGLPGVYRMLGARGEVLYVGKARDLKKRVVSYFPKTTTSPRIAHDGVAGRDDRNHGDALRGRGADAREQPHQVARAALQHPVPRRQVLSVPDDQRARVSAPGLPPRRLDKRNAYFGPFPTRRAVRESIQLLQRVFRLRTCEDTVFPNRSRPCLLHQIRRCTAPCVGLSRAAALRRGRAQRASCSWKAARTTCSTPARSACRRRPKRCASRRPRCSATRSRRCQPRAGAAVRRHRDDASMPT